MCTSTNVRNIKIKKEPTSPTPSSSDELKQEFAESAMNELLGWYGYEGAGGNSSGGAPGDEMDLDDDDVASKYHRKNHRISAGGDSSGPEYSDSGGGGGGGSGGGKNGSRWCGWCSRPIPQTGNSDQISGGFCSELCFSQSRRASFKRNRTCDWCKHVRHTVSHIDVRDGSRHLQFCGDKCLNQYKMHIFCRETQAHLDLHPHSHLRNQITTDSSLITPDLWLKDCRSESPPSIGNVDTEKINNILPSPCTIRVSSPIDGNNDREVRNTSGSPRKRHCLGNRRSARRAARCVTSTITSTSNCQTALLDPASCDTPQDLRVRPKTPPENKSIDSQPKDVHTNNPSLINNNKVTINNKNIQQNDEKKKSPNLEEENNKTFWPPLPPPVTVLVPYPVVVPVPLPFPLPIPIPVPEELFKKFKNDEETTTKNTTFSNVEKTVLPTTTPLSSPFLLTKSVINNNNSLDVNETSEEVNLKENSNKKTVLKDDDEISNLSSGRTLRNRKRPKLNISNSEKILPT